MKPGDAIDVWVVEAQLGSGGMGSVYRCHNRSATRILAAVKILDRGLRSNQDAMRRFVREADILGQVDHPNIVKIRNVRYEHDPPYLEMEFVAGRSLESLLDRGALRYETARSILIQIADALGYLHERGVRHRDLKPANVLVQDDGQVKLVDFGLAVEIDRSRITQEGMAFGTVSYAPPEWVTPDKLDPVHWDFYALGVVAWEAFTGNVAFPVSGQGSARQQALQVMMAKQGHEPMDVGPDFPEPLRDLVRALTMSDPALRLTDARVILERARALPPHMRPGGANVTLAPTDFDGGATPEGAPRAQSTLESEPSAEVVEPPPAPPPREAIQQPSSGTPARGLAIAAFGGAGVAVVAGLIGLVVVVGGVAAWFWSTAPRDRTVLVTATGDEGLPVDLAADRGTWEGERDGARVLTHVGPGPLALRWVVGEGCTVAACDAGSCPPWCASGSMEHRVPPGAEALDVVVRVQPPPPVQVALAVTGLAASTPVTAHLGSSELQRDGDRWTFDGVRPGTHPLVLSAGSCEETAAGCWPEGSCPPGCLTGTVDVVVAVDGSASPATLELSIPTPEPAPAAPAPAPVTAPKPRPRSGWATVGMLEGFLADNAAWRPGTPRASAGGSAYLRGWSADGHPPAGTSGTAPATGVTGELARKVCQSAGMDLADTSDLADATDLELRRDGAVVKLVERPEGSEPTLIPLSNTAVTGARFRCRR
ncbi:MAG: serine/threonine protein kinase [Alphaproteobacteria bacterium]|nr:serine/threonine protein kinase [Alphaproteobacteria bacterium]MCB9698438.1 serine/threonine protein kinase [Alphaproteobacteria bacterium]